MRLAEFVIEMLTDGNFIRINVSEWLIGFVAIPSYGQGIAVRESLDCYGNTGRPRSDFKPEAISGRVTDPDLRLAIGK